LEKVSCPTSENLVTLERCHPPHAREERQGGERKRKEIAQIFRIIEVAAEDRKHCELIAQHRNRRRKMAVQEERDKSAATRIGGLRTVQG